MKKNEAKKSKKQRLLKFGAWALGIALGLALSTVIFFWLRNVSNGQRIITDVSKQVVIESGKMVKADAIKEAFCLSNGTNLAKIDFIAKREEILKKYPTIRDIHIEQHLPAEVGITIYEREPFARMGLKGRKGDTGRVVDVNGVVFPCRRGTSSLPIIQEVLAPGTPIGQKLEGRALAALRLLLAVQEPTFASLGIIEISIEKHDYILAKLASYSSLKINWSDMDERESDGEALHKQLKCVLDAMESDLSGATSVWNATIPGQVSSDNRGVH